MLTAERLRELLTYDPASGHFLWNRNAGRAGRLTDQGYWRVKIEGRGYSAHRLAWLYMRGEWPNGPLDHINCVRADNRISNLREATHTQNRANSPIRANNRSGAKGVHWNGRLGKWIAQIQCDGNHTHLGSYSNIDDAKQAYADAARRFFGEFARAA